MIYQRSVFYGVKADFRFFTAKHSLGLLRFLIREVHRCAAKHVPICVCCIGIAVEVVEIQSAERGFGHGEKCRTRSSNR